MNILKKIGSMVFITLLVLSMVGCGSSGGPDLTPESSRKTIGNVPGWFMDTPEKEGFKYHSATATSQDLQMAIDKATLNSANALAGQMDSEMNRMIKRAAEETGLGEDSHVIDQFSQAQEQIISQSLKDYSISKKEVQEEKGNIYRAYVLVEWDAGAANKRLLARIKADEQIYTAMRATELFDEMEKKVEAYRNRK